MVDQTPRYGLTWPFNPRAIRSRRAFLIRKGLRVAGLALYYLAAFAGVVALVLGAFDLLEWWVL